MSTSQVSKKSGSSVVSNDDFEKYFSKLMDSGENE